MASKKVMLEILMREFRKYPWASDDAKFVEAMRQVVLTLNGGKTCDISSPSWLLAWKEMRLKGKPTFKAIHALPHGYTLVDAEAETEASV